MALVLIIFLAVLLIAGVVLIWEARTGRFVPSSPTRASIRAALFFAAVVVGGALLARTAGSSPLMALTLVPVTALSLYRFSMLMRPVVSGTRRQLTGSLTMLAAVLLLGLGASLSLLPQPLDQRTIIEHIFFGDSPGPDNSIDPAARRTSRV